MQSWTRDWTFRDCWQDGSLVQGDQLVKSCPLRSRDGVPNQGTPHASMSPRGKTSEQAAKADH
jgi:hypothetical protein